MMHALLLTRTVVLAAWMVLWMLGGVWLAGAAFRLEKAERLLVGIALGLAVENLLANLLARFLPIPAAAWVAAGLTCLLGLLLALRNGYNPLHVPLPPGTLLAFGALSLLCYALGSGFGLFDEFLQLPTISLLASGAVPARFALDPSIPYEYHYFILFTSAQAARIGGIHFWSALDLLRGLTTSLALCLAFHWTRRLTRSSAAGILAAAFLFFGSGARWLLLLLPGEMLKNISSGMLLLGSGIASGSSLPQALANQWVMEGTGPIPFPFAFTNGIFPPGVLQQFVANGLTEYAFTLALLLSFTRWRSSQPGWAGRWVAVLATALIFSSMGLLTEAGVVLELGGLGLAVVITAIRHRSLRLPASLWAWLAAVLGGHLLGIWQGGALTGILLRALGLTQSGDYHSIGFQFVFPPTVVSSHLGVLSLLQPGQMLVALAELGPVLLVLPLLFIWGWKALRAGRWYEAALAGEALLALGLLFVQFTGSEGIRNTSRLYRFSYILVLFAIPLVWNWAVRRGKAVRWGAAALAGIAMLGGVGLFAAELPALQKPVTTYFISEMDVRMLDRWWNRLEPDTLVFDLVPYRASTVLGRYTNSSLTWYTLKPEWKDLSRNPLPAAARAYGFSYAYMDNFNFDKLTPTVQQAWEGNCVRLVDEAAYEGFWRRLYDIKDCQ
jgi:hypothetical protein